MKKVVPVSQPVSRKNSPSKILQNPISRRRGSDILQAGKDQYINK